MGLIVIAGGVALLAASGALFLLAGWVVLGIDVLRAKAIAYFAAVGAITTVALAVLGWWTLIALALFAGWQLTVFAGRRARRILSEV